MCSDYLFEIAGIGLTDTRELEGMASKPVSKNTFSVKEFDELENLAEDIFGGEACGMLCSEAAL